MKGIALWMIIIIITTIPIAIFGGGYASALNAESIKDNAIFLGLEIAGIINLLQAAPDGTTHVMELPEINCQIDITGHKLTVVTFPKDKFSFTTPLLETKTSIIITDLEPEEGLIKCSKSSAKKLKFAKDSNQITYAYA